jgi:hypothetical protein
MFEVIITDESGIVRRRYDRPTPREADLCANHLIKALSGKPYRINVLPVRDIHAN